MNNIQKARDVLAKWRTGATEDRWVRRLTNAVLDSLAERERVVSFGGYSDADAALIVGTAGNPDLLDAIDSMLERAAHQGLRGYQGGWIDDMDRLAAAIIAADERMQQ